MDIEQLRDIVKRKDGEAFCQFFLQLKLRDFLFLSNVDYLEIMRLAKHIGREGIIRETSFFTSLYNKARKYQTKKLSTRDLMPRDYLSLFYYDLFLQLYPDHNKKFTSALMAKGDIILDYAEQGEITIESLEESINCYDEAALIFERERAELDYAEAMMKKGYSLITLVDHGAYTYTIDKIEKSIKCYDEAASIFKREKAELDYARALMHKGISLNRLAEQGIDTIENLNESLKCYYKAGNIFKKEKAEVDYAGTLMNEGVSLRKLAEQGVDVERNFASAMKLYEEAEGIFHEKDSLLELAMVTDNHIRGLWWRFQKTKEEKYLIQASNLCDNSIGSDWFIDHFRHPAVKSIIKMSDRIHDMLDKYLVLDKNKYDEIIKRIDEIKRDSEQTSRLREETRSILKTLTPREEKVLMLRFGMSNGTEPTLEEVGQCFQVTRERIRQIEAKALRKLRPLSKRKNISIILNKIEKSTQQIIETIKRSGEEVSEEVAKGFTSLADDLRVSNEEQRRKILQELCRLLTDPSFQYNLLSKSPPRKSSLIRNIFQRIGKVSNEIAGAIPAALLAHPILYYFERLWSEALHLSDINSALVLSMVLLPFLAFKDRLSKS